MERRHPLVSDEELRRRIATFPEQQMAAADKQAVERALKEALLR